MRIRDAFADEKTLVEEPAAADTMGTGEYPTLCFAKDGARDRLCGSHSAPYNALMSVARCNWRIKG